MESTGVRPDESTRSNWADPGTFEVTAGVYRIPLPLPNDGLRAVNVYVITSGDEVTFIDAGWAISEARELLDVSLSALDLSVADVRRFLITHVHRDHYSQAITLRQEFGGHVSLGAGDRASLELAMTPNRHPLESKVAFIKAHGAVTLGDTLAKQYAATAHVVHPGQEFPDAWLNGGERLQVGNLAIDVVPTPGHTDGHMVFHATEERLLFAGDHVLPTITPSIGFEPAPVVNPLGNFLGSLATVRARPDARLLPAHGPITNSAHERIDELIAHHGRRLDEAERAIANGAHTAYDVAQVLRWTRHERHLDDLDLFNQLLAVCETAAHIELLVAQGRLVETDVDGLRAFAVPQGLSGLIIAEQAATDDGLLDL